MRLAKNLIENARVDSIDSMIICLRLIDELGKHLQGKNWDIKTIEDFKPEWINPNDLVFLLDGLLPADTLTDDVLN